MRRPDTRGGVVVAVWLLAFASAASSATRGREADFGGDFRVLVQEPRLTIAVLRALDRASSRLSRPDCAAVLGDFVDREGRPLSARLDALGLDTDEYLRSIDFVSGDERPRCGAPEVMAVTFPATRVVYVCRYFGKVATLDPAFAEVALIHEALHTLGLGEDPPSSAEINAGIRARCGSATSRNGPNGREGPDRRVQAAVRQTSDARPRTEDPHAHPSRSTGP